MNKFVLCIGTLGLVACSSGGGGSGGGTMYARDVVRIDKVSDDVMESNRHVTNMSSEVLIAENASPDTVARAASGHVMMDGHDYMSYRLDDVKFETGDAHNSDMSFVLDKDGQIIGLRIADDTYNRVSNTDVFESAAGDKVQYVALGKKVGDSGLHYSDFGTITFNPPCGGVVGTDTHDMTFAGGYDATHVDKSRFTSNMTFTGVAHGAAGDVVLNDNNATLTFDQAKGTETLAAAFTNWYDVNITRDGADMVTFKLVGDNKNPNGYATLTAPKVMQDKTQNNNEGIEFSVDYYGSPVTGTATEATALMNYYQGVNSNRTNVSIGFGGVAQ